MLPTLINFHFSLTQIPVSAMAVSEIMLRYCNSDDKINYIPRWCPSLAKHCFMCCKSQPCTCAQIQTWGSDNWFMKEGIEFWKHFCYFVVTQLIV